jgi:hypothetical protein
MTPIEIWTNMVLPFGGFLVFLLFGGGVSAVVMFVMPYTHWGVMAYDDYLRPEPGQRPDLHAISIKIMTNVLATVMFGAILMISIWWLKLVLFGMYFGITVFVSAQTRDRWWRILPGSITDTFRHVTWVSGQLGAIFIVFQFFGQLDTGSLFWEILSSQGVTTNDFGSILGGTISSKFANDLYFVHLSLSLCHTFIRFVRESMKQNGWLWGLGGAVCVYPLAVVALFLFTSNNGPVAIGGAVLFFIVWSLYAYRLFWNNWREVVDVFLESHCLFGLVLVNSLIGTDRMVGESFGQMLMAVWGQIIA